MAKGLEFRAARGRGFWGYIAAIVVIVVVAAAVYFLKDLLFGRPTQVVVRNNSSKTLSLVELVMRHPGGAVTTERFGDVAPDEEHIVYPLGPDFTARLTFIMADGEHVCEKGVDLWRGETFVFEIEPDAAVRAGHDYGHGTIEE
jgi:hypothetical protein